MSDEGAAGPPDPVSTDASLTLSSRQFIALRNLASKQAGEAVDWINIADARTLTEFGFANRSREGWRITAAGSAALLTTNRGGGEASSHISATITHIRRAEHEGK